MKIILKEAGSGREAAARLTFNENGSPSIMADWSVWDCDRALWSKLVYPVGDVDRAFVTLFNRAHHLPLVSPRNALHGPSWKDLQAGSTLVIVAPGPSSAGVAARLGKPHNDKFEVCACNRAARELPNAEFISIYDRFAPVDQWLPDRKDCVPPILITHPASNHALAAAWSGYRNRIAYYWLSEVRNAEPELECLGMLAGARHIGVTTIHAAYVLGYRNVLLVGFDFSTKPCEKDAEGRSIPAPYYMDGGFPASGEAPDMGEEAHPTPQNWFTTFGITGERERTNQRFVLDAAAMRVACEIGMDAGMRIVNCAGRGILSGVPQGRLEDELARL